MCACLQLGLIIVGLYQHNESTCTIQQYYDTIDNCSPSAETLLFICIHSLVPRPSHAPARKRVWNLSQDFLALLSQHVRKTGKPIRTQDSKESCDFNAYWNTARFQFQLPSVYMLALESARTPKAHDNRSELCKILHRADSAMPRNPAKDSRPSFGRVHVRVWERD